MTDKAPTPVVRTNAAGLALIKAHEGLRLKAYRDPVGVWTIGYGHTSAAGPPKVTPGMTISRDEAEAILRRDLGKFEIAVTGAVKAPLNDNQFAALVSFCFNVGEGALRSSSVLRRVNERNFAGVPGRLALWCKANGKVLPGLVRRRKDEGHLFMAPVASTAAVQPPNEFGAAQVRQPDDPGPVEAPRGPKHGKDLRKSRTLWGASSAALGAAGGAVSDAGAELAGISHLSAALTIIFVLLTLAGIGLVTYSRLDDAGLFRKDEA